MRTLRRDVTTGEWTVIASERAARPVAVPMRGLPDVPPERCPFCPGHERATGPAIVELRDGAGWSARVIPNRYPALDLGEPLRGWAEGPHDAAGAKGAHEVLIECAEHGRPLWHQPPERMRTAIRLARDRMRDLSRDFRLHHHAWFRNVGLDAGASQSHPHAQLVALPLVPERVERMRARARAHLEARGRSLYADLVDHERAAGARIVRDAGGVVAMCPYAPSADAELWFIPDADQDRFRDADDAVVDAVADALSSAYRAIERVLGPTGSTLMLFSAPEGERSPGFRWHFRLVPRRVPTGGLELATGTALVGLGPEDAARLLRGAL